MLRKCAIFIALACLFSACLYAQGLNTQASKNDWEEINFEFDSAVLSDGYPSLLRLADLLHNNSGYHVRVEGNTDVIGSERYNDKLGLARANTVRDFLVKYGAAQSQIETASRGKRDPKYPGFKSTYSKTDVARWMNRRVVLTVTDQNGRTVSDGGVGQAIQSMQPAAPATAGPNCCDDILRRLDQITALLNDMKNQNADLRRELDTLKNQQAGLQNQINNAPKPLTEAQTAQVVDARLEKNRDPRFALLGLNVGADQDRNVTFTGSGRFFAPFRNNFAVQIQGEYMYFRTQKEGQADIGLVSRIKNFQGGVFASFKNVSFSNGASASPTQAFLGTQTNTINGATGSGWLGQSSAVFDYIFKYGKVGVYGTYGFMNRSVLSTANATFTDASGNTIIAPNIFLQRYLSIMNQAGAQGTIGLFGNAYLEANAGWIKGASGSHGGTTIRFVFPLNTHLAVTVEGGVNETLIPTTGSNGRAVVGIQFGNFIKPKDFATVDHPVPMQVPRIRYEVLTRNIHNGVAPPVADAGPDQIGVPAGTITLNGSGSHDPNGETLTYQWIQEAGPAVALTNANQPIATFTAAAGQVYSFRLTVRNTDGQTGAARVRITTLAPVAVDILFFNANPQNVNLGQSSTLSWRVQGATTVTISGIGNVNPSNGTVSVQPTDTTTYVLTASNANGSQTAQTVVTVVKPQAQITVCTAVPMTIMQGESATLYFQTLNATSVSIAPGVGSSGVNGNVVVSPTTTTNYTITATNATGSTDTCSVSVGVTPASAPRIVKFTASPLTIPVGSTSTLLWVVENATSVSISPGVGTVDLGGTANVQPATTTTYTLTASNRNGGSVTATVTVNVTQPPPPPTPPTITSFTASPAQSPNPGTAVTLTCQATNAKQVVISGVGPVSSSGTITVNPLVTTTYVCVAVGPTGLQASANLTVPVTTTGANTGGGPVIQINSGSATCSTSGGSVQQNGNTTLCQTVVRTVNLDLTGTTSPNPPVSFVVSSQQTSAAVLNPNSPTPTVQLSELFGDYYFTVTATDAKGITSTAIVDVQYVRTSVR